VTYHSTEGGPEAAESGLAVAAGSCMEKLVSHKYNENKGRSPVEHGMVGLHNPGARWVVLDCAVMLFALSKVRATVEWP
jgi:hypothetical protein